MPDATTILVVEDDREIRESIVDALEDKGHHVVTAFDGLDAIEFLQTEGVGLPSLILLDLTMPRLDGIQFGREVAKVPDWSMIPIVVLSGDEEIRSKAKACGAVAYVKKPLKLRDLYRVVSHALESRRN